jgi:pre-mRNA-processing factor 39
VGNFLIFIDRPKIDDESCLMRDEIIIAREKIIKETEALVKDRLKFEENVKRPYFHIKPLEKSQLENWNSYLDFEEKQVMTELILKRNELIV